MSSIDQDVYWKNKAGELLNLEDIGPRYRRNLQWFLRGQSITMLYNKRKYAWERSSWLASGSYDWDHEGIYPPPLPSRQEASEWLESTSLMTRLCEMVAEDLMQR